jgi:hypothetical protein
MNDSAMTVANHPTHWNKAKLIGQKRPLKLGEIWTLQTRLGRAGMIKEVARFNLAIDSRLRGCDLVQLRVNDLARGGEVVTRASGSAMGRRSRCWSHPYSGDAPHDATLHLGVEFRVGLNRASAVIGPLQGMYSLRLPGCETDHATLLRYGLLISFFCAPGRTGASV